MIGVRRRSILRVLIGTDAESREEFNGDGAAFFKACADRGLEGIVSKLATAPYRSGRGKTVQVLHQIHFCCGRDGSRSQNWSA